tara:strand:+ start:94 stop:696 length:603 start_codon:yes stop_codon:yes gene_type:complete
LHEQVIRAGDRLYGLAPYPKLAEAMLEYPSTEKGLIWDLDGPILEGKRLLVWESGEPPVSHGMRKLLHRLRREGHPQAIVSAERPAEFAAAFGKQSQLVPMTASVALGLTELIEASAHEAVEKRFVPVLGIKGWTMRYQVREALSRLNVQAATAVFIGDSVHEGKVKSITRDPFGTLTLTVIINCNPGCITLTVIQIAEP